MKKAVNMRLEQEVIDIIEKQAGDTFTEKFNNLVFRLEWEREKKVSENKRLDKLIGEKSSKLEELGKALYDASQIVKPHCNVWGYEKRVV